MFQLSQLEFASIGAISRDHAYGVWHVSGRPFTYTMNELACVAGYPDSKFPTELFGCASEYLRLIANEHLTQLWTQRSLVEDSEIAQQRFIARHRFAQLVSEYHPEVYRLSLPFCDDIRPSYMLIDLMTLQITAVLDFEFTNAMPAEFMYDPPW
jgi:hypothetical protein